MFEYYSHTLHQVNNVPHPQIEMLKSKRFGNLILCAGSSLAIFSLSLSLPAFSQHYYF